MPKGLTKLLHEYRSPSLILKYPRLIYVQYVIAWSMTERFWHVNKLLRKIIAKKNHDVSILDIGCGSGELIYPWIIKNPNIQFTGLDKNENALQTARVFKQFRKLENFEIKHGDIGTFDSNKKYNVICAVSVLQYVDDVTTGLTKLSKTLKPEGVMLLYIPINFNRILPGYSYIFKNWLKDLNYDAKNNPNSLTEKDLLDSVRISGLRVQEKQYAYGMAGKVAYELTMFGQLIITKLPWILAIVFALIYFPIIILPAWLLMCIDLLIRHRNGNGLILIVSANKKNS